MRRSQADKLPRRYDLGFLPESREMPLIAGNQVVRARRIGAFDKHIVVRVAGDFKAARRTDNITVVLDELQQLLANPFADIQLWTRQHSRVFLQECAGGPLA
jgi:hypothetical protein